jgi:hypothetical protein
LTLARSILLAPMVFPLRGDEKLDLPRVPAGTGGVTAPSRRQRSQCVTVSS